MTIRINVVSQDKNCLDKIYLDTVVYMTYCLQIDNFKFFSNFMFSFVIISLSHDYENFPCCFLDKHGCMLCDVLCDCLKLELYILQKIVVLIKFQKLNKSGKQRMQESKCFYSNFWSKFSNLISLTICILGRSVC